MSNFKRLGLVFITILLLATTPVFAKASISQPSKTKHIIVTPLSIPLEVTLTTNKTIYNNNEVVQSIINISGGKKDYLSTPTYCITYSDSTGHSYTLDTTKTTVYYTKAYETGNYTINIQVTSSQSTETAFDSATITVK